MHTKQKISELARFIQTSKQEAQVEQTFDRKEEKQIKFTVNSAGQV